MLERVAVELELELELRDDGEDMAASGWMGIVRMV